MTEPVADPTPAAPERSRSRRKPLLLGLVAIVVLALAVGGYFVYDRYFAMIAAEVGDCVAGDPEGDVYGLDKVDCNADDAAFKVIGKVDNKTEAEVDEDVDGQICAAFDKAEFAYFEGLGEAGTNNAIGSVYCLAPHDPASTGGEGT